MEGRIQQLTLRHDNIRSTSQKTRETILEAVGWLESENAQLRNLNADIMAQMRRLVDENERLKQQLASLQSEQQQNAGRAATLQDKNKRQKAELEALARKQKDERRRIDERETQLREENAVMQRQINTLKTEVGEIEAALTRARQEARSTTAQLSRAQRRNFNDRDIELLHEVDVLHDQQRQAQRQSDEADSANTKLREDLCTVQANYDEKVAELRNESRRHSLLTKEFNSLLDENNKVKQLLMLRRRQGAMLQQQQQQRDAVSMGVSHGEDAARNNMDTVRSMARQSECISERLRAGTTLHRARSMLSLDQHRVSQSMGLNHQTSLRQGDKNTFARESSFLSRESTFFRQKNVNGTTKPIISIDSADNHSASKDAEVTQTETTPAGNLPILSSAKTWRP